MPSDDCDVVGELVQGETRLPGGGLHPALDDSAHRRLYEYWLAKRAGRRMPARADVEPLELGDILGDFGLIDVEPRDPPRFRYRLIGTNMVEFFGRDFTGETVEQSKSGNYARKLLELYRECAQLGTPVYWEGVFEYQNRTHWRVKRLLLPLSSDGRTVDMILFSTTFAPRHGKRRRHPGQTADAIVDMIEWRRAVGE